MSDYSYLLVTKELTLFLADLTLALFCIKGCKREYSIIERVPKVTKVPKVS